MHFCPFFHEILSLHINWKCIKCLQRFLFQGNKNRFALKTFQMLKFICAFCLSQGVRTHVKFNFIFDTKTFGANDVFLLQRAMFDLIFSKQTISLSSLFSTNIYMVAKFVDHMKYWGKKCEKIIWKTLKKSVLFRILPQTKSYFKDFKQFSLPISKIDHLFIWIDENVFFRQLSYPITNNLWLFMAQQTANSSCHNQNFVTHQRQRRPSREDRRSFLRFVSEWTLWNWWWSLASYHHL